MNTVVSTIDPRKYGRLLSNALPSVIKTEEENDRALVIVDKLLVKGPRLSFEETTLLELLGKLIADFEGRFYRPKDAMPHEVLFELMQAKGLKQADLVGVLGSKSRVSEAISGKRELSRSQIRDLAQFFDVSSDHFI